MAHPIQLEELIEPIRSTDNFPRLEATLSDPVLKLLSGEFRANPDSFERHYAICAQIGATDNPKLRDLLIQLRDHLETEMISAATAEILEAFSRSAEEGWRMWVRSLASALVSVTSRRHALRLCEQTFPFDPSQESIVADLRKAVECILQGRWDEAYEQLDLLSQQDYLPAISRGRLVMLAGQIDLSWFAKPERCRTRLESATRMAPADGSVLATWGDYWRQRNKLDKAKSYYQHSIQVAPRIADGYVGMGDLVDVDKTLDEQARIEEAEKWYRKAISRAGGDSLGYGRLFLLLGRPQNLPTREEEFLALVERTIAVDPDSEYQICLDVGDSYLANQRFTEAKQWYDKAVSLHPQWPRAYTALAQWRRGQADAKATEEAIAYCKKAIEVAPEASTGYFSLGAIYVEKSQWAEASAGYNALPGFNRPLGNFARASVGRMQAKLENYEDAERRLFKELHDDAEESYASGNLEELAADYYKMRKDVAAAERIYDELLRTLGESYAGCYHNWLGNMHYFSGDYKLASEEYQKAIAAAPDQIVYYRNLSGTYEVLHDYENACHALESVLESDRDEKWRAELARLSNLQGNNVYGKGDYERAKASYSKAIELNFSDAVYHTNLAAAWKQLKEKGQREHALEQAILCYENARRIADKPEYRGQIERLSRRRDVVKVYGERPLDFLPIVTPIAVEVAADLVPYVEGTTPTGLSDELTAHVNSMRETIRKQLGLWVPGIRFRGNEGDLPKGVYIVMINEIPLVLGTVSAASRFYRISSETFSRLGVAGDLGSDALSRENGYWIPPEEWPKLETEKLEFLTSMHYLMRHVEAIVRKNAVEFLGHQEAFALLENDGSGAADQIQHSSRDLTALTTVSRALLAEDVPLQPLAEICAALGDGSTKESSLREVVEHIRMLPSFRQHLRGADGSQPLLQLTPRFEASIRRSLYERDGHSILAMEPERCQKVLSAVGQVSSQTVALVVKDAPLRPLVRKLLELQFPHLHVLSAAELPSKSLGSAAMIDLEDEPADEPVEFRNPRRFNSLAHDHEKNATAAASFPTDRKIGVFVSESFEAQHSPADDKPLRELLAMMQEGLFYELGIILPKVPLQTDPSFAPSEFSLQLNDSNRESFRGLEPDEFLVNDTVERLKLLNIEANKDENPANGNESARAHNRRGEVETCRQAGLTTWGPHGYLVLQLSSKIRLAAAQFQTDTVTQYMLDSLGEHFPDLVRVTCERYELPRLTAVLRELLEEEISIRDLRGILESLLSLNGTTDVDFNRLIVFTANAERLCPVAVGQKVEELTPAQLAEFVRTSLQRYISHKYTRGRSSLVVYLLDSDTEQRLSNAESQPLTAEEREDLYAAIRSEIGEASSTATSPVILTGFDSRRPLRTLIAREFPRLAVLSYQELSPELNIQSLGRIKLARR